MAEAKRDLKKRLEEAESALRAAREDRHPSVHRYFERYPDADTPEEDWVAEVERGYA